MKGMSPIMKRTRPEQISNFQIPPENVKANVMRDITGLIAVPVDGKSDTHTLSYVSIYLMS